MIFRGEGGKKRQQVYDQIKQLKQNDWIKKPYTVEQPSLLIAKQYMTESNLTNPSAKGKNGLKHTSQQLMEHLLKGVNCEQSKACLLSTQEEEQQFGELLTNRYKLEQYKLQIRNQIIKGHTSSTPYCKALLLLLNQISKSQIQIKYAESGLEIGFNERKIRKQQQEIDRLHNQNDKKKRQLNDLSKQYQKIVYQFNEVIQKLVGNTNFNRNV